VSATRRFRVTARRARLLAGEEPPRGSIDSLDQWIAAQPDGAGNRLLTTPAPARPPRRPALTVQEPDELFERPGAASDPPLRAAILPGARLVTAHGLAVSPDNRVFAETAWDEEQLRDSGILTSGRLRRARRIPGSHASLVAAFCTNYFHWLTEALPRVAVLDVLGLGNLPLIVPSSLEAFHLDSLALLGIGADRLTSFDQEAPFGGDHLRPDTLVWPAPAAHTGLPAAWACAWLRERLAPVQAEAPRRRLYVSRGSARRSVANELELLGVFERFGVEPVLAEQLSFEEQVRLFSSAELVCGPHGAGLANALFATDATVVELVHPHPALRNPCFHALADAAGHRFWHVLGSGSGDSESAFTVPVGALERTLQSVLGGR
jgi:capsular polysaccharide biosynthesis protein